MHRNLFKTTRYLNTVVTQGTQKFFIRSENGKQGKLYIFKILSSTKFLRADSTTHVALSNSLCSFKKRHLVKTKSVPETSLVCSMTCSYAWIDFLEFLSSPFSHQENTDKDDKLWPVLLGRIWTVLAVTQGEASKPSAQIPKERVTWATALPSSCAWREPCEARGVRYTKAYSTGNLSWI